MAGVLTAQDRATPRIQGSLLEVGSPAPELRDLEWIAGEPVALAEGRVTVIEFWTTWCPQSRLAVRTLTHLQRRYPDSLRVVGIVMPRYENKRSGVEAFVAAWRARIGYAIAWDGEQRATAEWFDAARLQSYPVAFVVDGSKRVAWIGSPLDGLADALDRVHRGKLDVDVARQVAQLQHRLAKAQLYHDRDRLLELTARWIALEPARAQPWITRFTTLAGDVADAEAALQCTREALERLAAAPAELARFANEGLFAVADATDCHALGLETLSAAFASAGADPQVALAYFSALAATGRDRDADRVAGEAVRAAAGDSTTLAALSKHFVDRRHGKRFVGRAVAALRRATEVDPDNHHLDLMEFEILANIAGDDDAAAAVGRRIVAKARDDEVLLNEFAWNLLDTTALRGRFDALALAAAETMSARPSARHWMYVDTLARAKFVNGQIDEAVRLQRWAVKSCDRSSYAGELRDRLKTYEKAAAEKRK